MKMTTEQKVGLGWWLAFRDWWFGYDESFVTPEEFLAEFAYLDGVAGGKPE